MARRATVAFVALATADTFLAATGRDRQRRLTKPLLMPMLMIGRDRAGQRALALGWAGDMALLGAGDAAFMAGLASFLASHLAWIAVLRQRHTGGRLRARPALAAPYIAAFGALNAYLWKRTGKDRIPVVVYSTALLAMSLAALDSRSPKAATGGALFLVSDTLLALEKFAAVHLSAHQGLVMAMYAGAQALLAESSVRPSSSLRIGPSSGCLPGQRRDRPLWRAAAWLAATGMVLDCRVGGGEEHALVAIAPADEIGWRAFLAMHLDDHGFAVLITYVMSPDHQLIANICSHRSSSFPPQDHHLAASLRNTGPKDL